jgi:hypothetical protein
MSIIFIIFHREEPDAAGVMKKLAEMFCFAM